MANEKEKAANHNQDCFSFELKKRIIYQIINSNLWIAKRSCNEWYI